MSARPNAAEWSDALTVVPSGTLVAPHSYSRALDFEPELGVPG